MARKKQEDAPKGSPAWMATFSDLMNLLLCFFVLLFSMSTVDLEKFQLAINSIQSSFSILPSGGASIGDGQMVGAGISQLPELSIYYREANTVTTEDAVHQEGQEDILEQFEAASLAESEEMAEDIAEILQQEGIGDRVQMEITSHYVQLTLNGALLFDSGHAEIREDALPLVDKLGKVLETYSENTIGVEGHTDNVPISGTAYESNDVLAAYRALAVKDYFLAHTTLEASRIRATSYGEYSPVADNGTAEGRALNRRVEIKIYNSLNSD